eukprot:1157596-Pelagomonas_calceolata.AAC.13
MSALAGEEDKICACFACMSGPRQACAYFFAVRIVANNCLLIRGGGGGGGSALQAREGKGDGWNRQAGMFKQVLAERTTTIKL